MQHRVELEEFLYGVYVEDYIHPVCWKGRATNTPSPLYRAAVPDVE